MTTTTILAMLRTEAHLMEEAEQSEVGPRNIIAYRPVDAPLRNDGVWHFWMQSGQTYRLDHDGTGWRVACDDWTSGHTYRLVEARGGQFTDALPTAADGALRLERGRVYELREVDLGAWAVYPA